LRPIVVSYMSLQEQTDAFGSDLEALIKRYRGEFDMNHMNLPAIVGMLYMHANYIALEGLDALAEEEEDDEDDDEESFLS